jgi:RNA polymerase sigma factor (sigma-70 family)
MPDASMNRVMHFLRRTVGPAGGEEDGELLRRFIAAREEAAFAGLVRRHGAMVLGVCRRVLDDTHDAEDAFQATFLVLARRAASVRKQDSVASWLYGVAYRVARKARTAAAQRPRAAVEPAELVSATDPVTEAAWRELRPLIDEELSRLPEKYRAPLVLCYLEGKTNEEAARLLGWTKGTVSGRLARARDLLRPRLARRGLALTAGGVALLLAQNGAAPAALVETTVRAVLAGGASAPAAVLAEGVLRAMFLKKVTTLAAVVLTLGLVGGGVGLLLQAAPAAPGGNDEEVRRAADGEKKESAGRKPGVLFTLPEEPMKESEDLKKLQGLWQAIALEHNGQKLSAEAVKLFQVVISDSFVKFRSGATESGMTFKLDTSSKPKAIWLKLPGASAETVRGIYALEDDHLKLCVDNDEGKKEPTEFATKPDSGLTLMVLERVRFTTAEVKPPEDSGGARTLVASGAPVRAVAFSPDGKSVWGCSEDGRAWVWDAATAELRDTLRDDGSRYLAMAISPDGKRVLLGGTTDATEGKGEGARKVEAGWVALYSASLRDLIWHTTDVSPVRAVAFSPDGKRVAAGCQDGKIRVTDAETGKVIFTPGRGQGAEIAALAFSPDGKLLARAGGDKLLLLWDAEKGGRELNRLAGHTGKMTAVKFSPDGRHLLTAGQDGSACLWDVATGKELRRILVPKGAVLSVAFSPDGRRIAAAGEDGAVRLFDLATGKELATFAAGKKAVNAVAFSPDGTILATGGADGALKLWDVRK